MDVSANKPPETRMRRYLALWFPYLPCERASRNAGLPDGRETPFALVMRTGNALQLAAVDAVARRQGLVAGMTLADARARCPGLLTQPHDPLADARELDRLTAAMTRFTPLVASDPPDGMVLDITGCAHLFGDEARLADKALAAAGYTARHAFADHAAAARALARYGGAGQGVRSLPVAALELPEEALAGLRRAGLYKLGDLAVRPMAGLAARFGQEAVTRLREILGEADSPLAPLQACAPIRARIAFAEPLLHAEDALDVIEELLRETARQMEARQIGGRRFIVLLERSDGARRRLEIETAQARRDPAPVMRLFRERIETLSDPLDPGFGYDAIALAVPRTEPLAARQIALREKGAPAEEGGVIALIDRLATRLGPGNILRPHPCDSYIPERAQRLLPATQAAAAEWASADTGGAADAAGTMPRPVALFDPPQPITVIAGVPDGPPLRFRWRGQVREVRLAEGPERIAAEWWRQAAGHCPNEGGLTRDYYRVEDEEGHRLWMFRHGLFDERDDPRWYVHGLFA